MHIALVILVFNVFWGIMRCNNTEILYVFFFLILFVVSYFLLVQYHMKNMSIGKKQNENIAKRSTDTQIKTSHDNKHNAKRISHSFSMNKQYLRPKNIYHKNIIEPAMSKEQEAEYAMNALNIKKSLNNTIFDSM